MRARSARRSRRPSSSPACGCRRRWRRRGRRVIRRSASCRTVRRRSPRARRGRGSRRTPIRCAMRGSPRSCRGPCRRGPDGAPTPRSRRRVAARGPRSPTARSLALQPVRPRRVRSYSPRSQPVGSNREAGDQQLRRRQGTRRVGSADAFLGSRGSRKIMTLPASSTHVEGLPTSVRRASARSACIQVMSGCLGARGVEHSGQHRSPTTARPRRASSTATRPVPHPASRTRSTARLPEQVVDEVGLAVDASRRTRRVVSIAGRSRRREARPCAAIACPCPHDG